MAKSGPLGPFSFRLLFWTTWPGRFPKASHLPPPAGLGLWEGSRSLHLHPFIRSGSLRSLKRRPPGTADTSGHTHIRESLKVSNRNPSYHPGHLAVVRQASCTVHGFPQIKKKKKNRKQNPCVQMKDALISEKGMEKIWFPLLI